MTETRDPIDEMDAGDERYHIDSQAVRRCPACRVPGTSYVDDHGQPRVAFRHELGCWINGALAARRRRHRPDEVDYLTAGPAPFEPADYLEDTP